MGDLIRLDLSEAKRSIAAEGSTPPPTADVWYDEMPGSLTGGTLTSARALRFSVAYACIRLWSYTMAMLPLPLYERLPQGERRKAEEDPLYELANFEPNEYQTPFEFKQEIVAGLAMRGNAYAEKIPGRRAAVAQLWPIHPDFLSVDWFDRRSGRRRVYDVSSSWDGRARVLRDDQVWHPRLMSLDGGLTGASPIAICSDSISIPLDAQRGAALMFQRGMRPAFQVVTDQKLNDDDATSIAKRIDDLHGGGVYGWFRPLVLGKGAEAKPLTITPRDAQLLEYLNYGVADTSRIWGVPLHLVQAESKDTSWGSGIEHLKLAFHGFTLAPLAELYEGSLGRALIIERRRFYFEFLMAALLRGDMKTQFECADISLNGNNPFYTRNEWRRIFNLPRDSGPDGDRFLVATNNVGTRQQREPEKGNGKSNGQSAEVLVGLVQSAIDDLKEAA